MNVITLYGRITRDFEVKDRQGTKIGDFTIAVQRPFKNSQGDYEADFINCSVFNENIINLLDRYTQKGDRISLTGRLQINSWQDKGEWKNFTQVIVNEVSLIETMRDREEQRQYGAEQPPQRQNNNYNNQNNQQQEQGTFQASDVIDDEDLPF